MRSKLLTSNVIFNVLLAGALVAEPFAVYADANINGADDAAFTCSSAINVMDCINQTQNPSVQQQSAANLKTAIPVSNQTFGFTGPVSFNVRYDQDLSWILDAGYAQSFGNRAAVALKASAGQNELRGNGTIGFAISPKQQIKITYEYLTQNLPFDYAAGTINEWVSQNAYGAAYRYMVGNSILQGIELSGSYTQANSKELSDVDLHDADGNFIGIDQRRIAGGQQKNGLASVILTPFKNTILKVGAGYSASSFDTKWSSDQAQSTVAYAVEATHLLTPKTLISTSVNNTATNRAHTVKVSRILPGNIEGNITGQYNVSHVDGIDSNANVTAGLSYPAPKTYSNMFAGGIGDLKSWVQQPVIYNARVLAIAEEKILTAGISTSPMPDASLPVNDNFQDINTVNTQTYFSFDKSVYDSVSYSIVTYLAGDPQKTPVNLNLQMTASGSYDATVTSSNPLPASAVGNQYTAVITANGYRKGQVVTPNVTNSFTLKAVVNADASAGQWINATLNSAIPGQNDYNSGLLTNSIGNGLSGDKYTFAIVNDDKHKAPDWLTLSSDGQSLVNDKANGKTVPADMIAPVQVTLTATSKATGKNVTTPNSTEDKQTFTINVNTANFKTPEWLTSGGSLLKLPDAIQGQDYSVKGVKLNPYTANPAWTTKTTSGGVDLKSDYLTFSLANNNCGSWLTLGGETSSEYGQDGLLSGTPTSTQPADCNVTVVVTSRAAGGKPTTFQKNQTIHVNAPTYLPPQFTATGLKNADADSLTPYEYHLDPYHTQGDAQVLAKTYNTLDPATPLDDTLSNFKFKSLACMDSNNQDKTLEYSSWLKLDEFGTLNSNGKNVPANASGSCTISVTYDSAIMGKGVSTTNTITLPINSPIPTWQWNTNTVAVPYSSTQPYKMDITYPYLNNSGNADYMSNVTANDLNTSVNLPSGGIAARPTSALADGVNHWYATINATTADVIGKTSPYIGKTSPFTGEFTVSVKKGNSANSDPAKFWVNVVDDLQVPKVINPGTSTLPAADIGKTYPQTSGTNYTLNPYDSTAVNPVVMTQTLLSDGKTQVPDNTLTFTRTDYADINADCNKLAGIGIDANGKITPGNFDSSKGPYPDACWLSFTVKSDRAGVTSLTQSIKIPINGSAPSWDNVPGTININFDNLGKNPTDFSDMNDLTKMINAEAAPVVTFAITDDNPHANWTLKPYNSHVYLVRQTVSGTLDATEVGGKQITIMATNAKGSATKTLAINVQPHSDGVSLTYTPALTVSAAAPKLHVGDIMQTKLLDGTPVNDLYFMDTTPAVCAGPRAVPVLVSNLGTGVAPDYVMDATTALTDSNNLGVYPNLLNENSGCSSSQLKFSNFYSAASKDKPKSGDLAAQGVKLTLSGQLMWKSAAVAKDLYFDAIAADAKPVLATQYGPGSCGDDRCGINLNNLLQFDPVAGNMGNWGISFTSDADKANWSIIAVPDGSQNYYLVRNIQSSGSRLVLNGNDINNSASTVNLMVSAPGMTSSSSLPLTVTIKPDARDKDSSPLVFAWDQSVSKGALLSLSVANDKTIPANTYKVTGAINNASDNSLIKLCINTLTSGNNPCSGGVVTNVTLKLPVYSGNSNNTSGSPLAVIGGVCAERIRTNGTQNTSDNQGALINTLKSDSTTDSYLKFAVGNSGDCNINTGSTYNLVSGNANYGPYTVVFHQVRLDGSSGNMVWPVMNGTTDTSSMSVQSPSNWLAITQ